MWIPAGSTTISANFIILNDNGSEPNEEFKLIIEPEGSVQLGSPAETVIYIVDDDCEFLWFVQYTDHVKRYISKFSKMYFIYSYINIFTSRKQTDSKLDNIALICT